MCNTFWTGSNDWLECLTVQTQEQVKPHMQQCWGQVLQPDQTVHSFIVQVHWQLLVLIRCIHVYDACGQLLSLCVNRKSWLYLLLTIAVGNMEAMAACWGRSWMVSRRRAGYMPSPRDMWLTACNRESKSTANATSSSPSIMFLVVVHHNWPPVWQRINDTSLLLHLANSVYAND